MSNDIVFTNNASALLAATINSTALSIQVAAGYGANFPSPTGDQYFYLTLEDDAGTIEIVKVTGRSTDILTLDSVADRGQDGTTAAAHTLNTTRCELRLVKSIMEEFLQKNGGTLTGNLDMNANNLIDPYITGSSARMLAGQIVNVPLRGLLDTSTNEIAVPVNGTSRATAGGAAILVVGDELMQYLDTAGVIIFDSATVGVRVIGGAYLTVEGPTAANNLSMAHDDTDFVFTFANTTLVNFTGMTMVRLNAAAELTNGLTLTTLPLTMQDLDIIGPNLIDFSLTPQAVAGIATTDIDYEDGSYVTLTLQANIASFSISNPPTSNVGTLRIKIVQGAGPYTIDWSGANVKWPGGGTAIVLSIAAGEIDFVDLWTDDGGTTWYAGSDTDWA